MAPLPSAGSWTDNDTDGLADGIRLRRADVADGCSGMESPGHPSEDQFAGVEPDADTVQARDEGVAASDLLPWRLLAAPHGLEPASGSEQMGSFSESIDHFIRQAEDLVQHLPESHALELMQTIERSNGPIAKILRSTLQENTDAQQPGRDNPDPTLELPHSDCGVWIEGKGTTYGGDGQVSPVTALMREGGDLVAQLRIMDSEALLNVLMRGDSPAADALRLRLTSGLGDAGKHGTYDTLSDESRLQDHIDDANFILSKVEQALLAGAQTDERAGLLSILMQMIENENSFVARMMYIDLLVTCKQVAEDARVHAGLLDHNWGGFDELMLEGEVLVNHLEEPFALSILDAIYHGAATGTALASLLYFHLLLRVESEQSENNVRCLLSSVLRQCRNSIRSLFGERPATGASSPGGSSAMSSRPGTRDGRPRRLFRDHRSPRTKIVDKFAESIVETVLKDMMLEEVAQACHDELRLRLAESSRLIAASRQTVHELQELIVLEQRANSLRFEDHMEEEVVDESSLAPPGTCYTFKLCAQGTMDLVVASVTLDASSTWASFREAAKEQLGYSISAIRYDDDFGPKQSKDIFCTNKAEWKEVRAMMEEDKEEIQDVLTVEVLKAKKHAAMKQFRIKIPPDEQGATIDLEDLNDMLNASLADLQAGQKMRIDCKAKIKASWTFYSRFEETFSKKLQSSVRGAVLRRKFCQGRELVLHAAHIFRPQILRHFYSQRWKARHTRAALKLQNVLRCRRARKLAYIATVETAALSMLTHVATAFIRSVSEEQRAAHILWILEDATNAALVMQRLVRFKLTLSRHAILEKFEREHGASVTITRLFRGIRTRKRFLRSAVAAVMTETILFGRPMERAFMELVKEGKATFMQAVFRRVAVERAMQGQVTSASRQIATDWAFSDTVMWIIENQDDIYVQPRRILAARWIQGRVRAHRWHLSHQHVCVLAMTFQVFDQRRRLQLYWRHQYDAVRSLDACAKRLVRRLRYTQLYECTVRVQDRVRSMRLIFATRKFKKLVDHLVDIARTNLYRRFYTHCLLVGDRKTVLLRSLARQSDFQRYDLAVAKRTEIRKKEEEQRQSGEHEAMNKSKSRIQVRHSRGNDTAAAHGAGHVLASNDGLPITVHEDMTTDTACPNANLYCQDEMMPSSHGQYLLSGTQPGTAAVTSIFSVDKLFERWQTFETEPARDWKRLPEHTLEQVLKDTVQIVSDFVAQQHTAWLSDQECNEPDSVDFQQRDSPGSDQTCWFAEPVSCCSSLYKFCAIELQSCKSKSDAATSIPSQLDGTEVRKGVIGWLDDHAEDLVFRWEACNAGPSMVLEAADLLLETWSGQGWILNPGCHELELHNVRSMLAAFIAIVKDGTRRFESLLSEFPNTNIAAALMQSLQEACALDHSHGEQSSKISMKASAYYEWQDCAGNASFKAESQLIFKWVSENQEAIFHQADESYRYATSPCFWAGLWTDFMEHLYRVRQLAAVMPLTLQDLLLSVEQYAMEFDSNYGPIEEPFRTYDDVWTLIYAGHSEYMDTTRKFTWTPDGYALNAASGELVPVDVPEIKSVRSIFSAVNSLAFDFEKKMLAMIMPSIRHCHPLGFLGVSSARRRRERVQVWAALSVETTICRFLNYAVRVLEGQALITLLRVFTILCLRRGTILLQLGCIETLSMRIVGGKTQLDVEQSNSAAFALRSLLSDEYVASMVSAEAAVEIAEHLKHPVKGTMHVSVVYCLQLIVRHNQVCKIELAHQTWLHGILLQLIRVKDGPDGMIAAVAMLIAMLSYDSEVAHILGQDPDTIGALIIMLQDAKDIVSRQSALTALANLGQATANIETMIQHHAFHDTLMTILATQSLQLFPLSVSLAVRFVKNPSMCYRTMQHPMVLNALLRSMTFSDVKIAAPATKILMALTNSIEKSWVQVNSAHMINLENMQDLIVSAGQVEQFGVNSFAMRTICNGIVSSYPEAQPHAATALRSILRCSLTACDWVLGNEEAMMIILDGVRHRDTAVQEQSIWSIHDLSARQKGAAELVKRGALVRLKVLLYTDCGEESKAAAIRSLKNFFLGMDRVAGPDEELIRRLTDLLRSESNAVQDASADLLARMIQQDYIDLFVHIYGAMCCPQSDNWGYCDPFVKLRINGQEQTTPIMHNTLSPVWNHRCQFSISDKSECLKIELYDWDNTGPEVLGEIQLSCERLQELGTELGLYRVGRELSEKAQSLKHEAETKATSIMHEGQQEADNRRQSGIEEATKLRDELLEEARFIGSDAKAEAKKIIDDTAAKAKELIDDAVKKSKEMKEAGQSSGQCRAVEFRAEQIASKLKEAAKKKAVQVQKVWEDTVKDIEDIPERIKQLSKQAQSKFDRITKETSDEADKIKLRAMQESFQIRVESNEESERIISLKEGWHILMERDGENMVMERDGPRYAQAQKWHKDTLLETEKTQNLLRACTLGMEADKAKYTKHLKELQTRIQELETEMTDAIKVKELKGLRGEIVGFDDNGKVVGPGGKQLESSPTMLNIKFEYCVNVNVDQVIYDQAWIVPRLFELLALVSPSPVLGLCVNTPCMEKSPQNACLADTTRCVVFECGRKRENSCEKTSLSSCVLSPKTSQNLGWRSAAFRERLTCLLAFLTHPDSIPAMLNCASFSRGLSWSLKTGCQCFRAHYSII